MTGKFSRVTFKMSCQTRASNGRFAKRKLLDRNKNALEAMAKAKKKCIEEDIKEKICEGRRIIEIEELAKNLVCCNCSEILNLKDIKTESRLGLHSILNIICEKCEIKTQVHTGKVTNDGDHVYSDTNKTAILGKLFCFN